MIDWQAYLAANPDVASAGVDPAQHYAQYGRAEGRQVVDIPTQAQGIAQLPVQQAPTVDPRTANGIGGYALDDSFFVPGMTSQTAREKEAARMAAGVDPRTVSAKGVAYTDTLGDMYGGRVLTPEGMKEHDRLKELDTNDAHAEGLRNAAKFTAAVFGGAALMGGAAGAGAAGTGATTAGTTAGTAAAATPASGLAGYMGMDAGVGASMVNSGALNAGRSLATGHNIGDAMQAGFRGAATSWLGTEFGDAIGTMGDGAISASQADILGDAGAQYVVNGRDAALNSFVMGEVGQGMDYLTKGMGLDKLPPAARQAGTVAIGSVLQGKNPTPALFNIAIGAGLNAAFGDSLNSIPGYGALSPKGKQAVIMAAAGALRGNNVGGAAFDLAMAEAGAETKRQKSKAPDFMSSNAEFDPDGPYGLPTSTFASKNPNMKPTAPFTEDEFGTPDQPAFDPVDIVGSRDTPYTEQFDPVTVTGKREPDSVLPPVTVTGKREPSEVLPPVTVTGKRAPTPTPAPEAAPPAARPAPTPSPAPTPPRATPTPAPTPAAPAATATGNGNAGSAVYGYPQLANITQKDFSSKKQRLNSKGQLLEDDDNNKLTPDVTVADRDETKENGPELSALGLPPADTLAALFGIT